MKYIIMIYSFVSVALLLVLEELLGIGYFFKQILRMGLFIFIPLISLYYVSNSVVIESLRFRKPKMNELKITLISSAVIFLGTVFGYLALQFMFKAQGTIDGLAEIGIGVHNVLIWGFYLSFINSFVEEFFFRGFVFYHLEKVSYKTALVYSSLLFSIYHTVLMILIFPIYTAIFSLTGLFIIGLFLGYINRYGKSFLNSWIIHISANLGCIVVLLHMYSKVQ